VAVGDVVHKGDHVCVQLPQWHSAGLATDGVRIWWRTGQRQRRDETAPLASRPTMPGFI